MDVLAANRLAQALSPHYRKGINLLRAVFLDPGDRILHQDWSVPTRRLCPVYGRRREPTWIIRD